LEADEALVLLASASLAAKVAIPWYARLLRRPIAPAKGILTTRLLIGAVPIALLVGLGVALLMGGAREVREHGEYVLLFIALGAVWLIGLAWAAGWLGMGVRSDAIERNNTAGAIAVSGALAGGMVVYTCANLGEGDTIWTTIGPASLATALTVALWGAHQSLSGATDAITLDRDAASGLRFAGMTLGTGLVIGRAAAGDYASASGTLRDLLVLGWPAVPLALLSVFIQVRFRPTQARPQPNALRYGAVPALAYLALGLVITLCLGHWSLDSATR
jgi:uncharacterized membrane protein YjfL (UPF0719 family)